MDDGEQGRLFGAPPGRVTHATIEVETNAIANAFSVRLSITTVMRNKPMVIRVISQGDQGIARPLGLFTQIAEKTYWVDGENIRQRMVYLLRVLNREGWDFDYSGLGSVRL